MAKSRKKGRSPRKVLRIPDLEHSKHAVINSLPAKASQESYEYAIDEFISWYCSEPRLAFNRTVVLRYRFFLEQKKPRPVDHQCSSRGCTPPRLRSLRLGAAEPGTGGRHCQSQRCQTVRHSDW